MPSSHHHRHSRRPCPHCQGAGFVDDLVRKIGNEFTNPDSVLRSKIVPAAMPIAKQAISTFVPGGSTITRGLDMVGLGAPRRLGEPRRTRPAPAHTAARNAIVRQVMRERGVSMIEASKIVRQEGLWQR